MKGLTRILLILIISATSLPTMADGNYLLQRCQAAVKMSENVGQTKQRAEVSYCYGLLQGVREVNRLYEEKNGDDAYFCLGANHLSHSKTAKLVVDYLRQNPHKLHQNESILAVQALRQQYPCEKKS